MVNIAKRSKKLIATILLTILLFQIIYPTSYAANPETPTMGSVIKDNPSSGLSKDPETGEDLPEKTDNEGNKLKDGDRENENIDYDMNEVIENSLSGTAPRREGDKQNSLLKAGTNIIAFVLSIIATFMAKSFSAIYIVLNALYWEEPPKDIDSEQYKGVKTQLFTLENLFFNRVKILDANIFRKSEKPNGTNQSIKDNVAQWTAIFRQIALVILLLVIGYLSIRLIISTIKEKPEARANYKLLIIDVVKSVALAFLSPIFVAIVLYMADFTTYIIWQIAKTMLQSDHLNFEKVIIYSMFDIKGFFTNPTKKLINTISFMLLVSMHIKFVILFMKRLLTISFLTIVSPIISITYAIDNYKDGKTQVFVGWAEEVVRLAFLMPLYAGIYTIFVIALGNLAEKVPLLGIVFLLLFTRVEKIVKELFNMKNTVGVKDSDAYSFAPPEIKKPKKKDYYEEMAGK